MDVKSLLDRIQRILPFITVSCLVVVQLFIAYQFYRDWTGWLVGLPCMIVAFLFIFLSLRKGIPKFRFSLRSLVIGMLVLPLFIYKNIVSHIALVLSQASPCYGWPVEFAAQYRGGGYSTNMLGLIFDIAYGINILAAAHIACDLTPKIIPRTESGLIRWRPYLLRCMGWLLAFSLLMTLLCEALFVEQYRTYQVQFVLPDKFRGIFVVKFDPTRTSIPEKGGLFIYEIPLNGELRDRDFAHVVDWNAIAAYNQSGVLIPFSEKNKPVSVYKLFWGHIEDLHGTYSLYFFCRIL